MEGIGLIEKKSKNSIQWKGACPGYATDTSAVSCEGQSGGTEVSERLITLKDEISELDRQERELDQHKLWVQQSIKNVTDEVTNTRMAYVTHEDICHCFKGDTLLAIQAPSGTQLEVPIPELGLNYKKNYQIHLKSTSGSINVLLVNKDTEETSPVVVQVPPPQDDPQNQNIDPDPKNTGKQGKNPRSPMKSPLRQSQQDSDLSRMATRSSPRKTQPSTSASNPFSSNLLDPNDLFDPSKSDLDGMDGDLIEELMSSEAFAPLLRLSPPPSDKDYYFNLDDTEGACDLFDVPLLTM